MSVEAEFYIRQAGQSQLVREDTIPPDTSKFYEGKPSLRIYVSADNSRSVFELGDIERVYAILYCGELDEEGEILDISERKILLKQGQELQIVNNGTIGHSREMWFEHTSEGGLNSLQTSLELDLFESSTVASVDLK